MKRIYFLGQSCRLPGASDVSELRRVLHEGRCTVSMIPTDRWNHELFLHPDVGMQGKTYTLAAGVLDDIWGFDLSVFALSPREAVLMDPQQRLLLQTVWEALEDAGIDPAAIAGQRVGVYVGASSMDHGVILGKDPSLVDAYTMTGNTLSLVANRISHAFDLRGPSFVVDTACSSSLVALDQARLALQQGDIDMAIVAGVNLLLHPGSFAGFSAARMLSPTGLCQSFSDSADGYVRSEGCVAVVLQAATVAPQGARAILIDSETNADGYTLNVALPAEEGQFQLLDRLYRRAGVSPDALDFVEAHGTGTLVGDPIEAHALGRALGQHRQRPLPIGSVKSNLGHLEPVSGLVGVLKTLIAFEDRVLPRSLHVDALNPDIDFDALKLVVARDEMPLRQDGPVLAGVSSFGFGGVNAHCILSAVPEVSTPRSAETDASDRPERIFVTSAFCEGALRDLAHDYAGMMRAPDALAPGGLIDQAWARRGLHPKRLGVLVDDTTQAATALDAFAAGAKDPRIVQVDSCLRDAPVVFAYSGNGGQYSGMSRLALRHDAAYRAAFEAIDSAFGTVVGWSLQDRLASETLGSDLKTCEVAQALLFADQAAQTLAFAARGIVPEAVIGHSGGEVAAAFACGALDLAQAVEVVVSRSRVTAPLAGHGRLAALQTSAEEAAALLVAFDVLTEALSASRKLAIAAINSPRSVTIVGPEPDLVQFSRWVRAEHRQACVLLEIHYPYHSAMQDPFEQELKAALAGLVPKVAHIPYFSSTLGMEIDGRSLDAEYWWANTRRPVQFEAAVKASLAGGYRCYMEIGPQPVLGSYLKDSIGEAMRAASVTHSLSAMDPPDTNPIARAHLRAILSGARTTTGTVFHTPDGPKVALPRYPWQNTPLRITDSPEIQRIHGTDADHHPLLGRAIAPGATTWRRDLDDRSMPVLKDHRIGHSAVLPGMAFIEMAYAAACKATGGGPVEITDLDIVAPLALSARSGVEVETRAEPETGRVWVKSRPRLGADAFRLHAQARFLTRTSHARPPETESPASLVAQDAKALWVYTDARHLGLHYGPGFQGLEALRHDGKIIDVVLRPGLGLNAGQAIAGFDPVQADCLLHGLITLATGETYMQEGRGFVPVRLERLQVFAPGVTVRSGQLQIRRRGQQSLLLDLTAFDAAGSPVVRFEGLRLRAVQIVAPIRLDRDAYHIAARACDTHAPRQMTGLVPLCEKLDAAHARHVAPQDDFALIVDAAVHQMLWTAFRRESSGTSVYACKRPDSPTEARLLEMLARSGLAQPLEKAGMWQIAANCDLPDAVGLTLGLLDEFPDKITDLSILLHLPEALLQVLDAAAPPAAEALFGREALRNLFEHRQAAQDFMTLALEQICRVQTQKAALSIGFLGAEPQGLLRFMQRHRDHDFARVLTETDGTTPGSPQYRDIAWQAPAALDLLVITEPAVLFANDIPRRLATALAPGAYMLVLCPGLDTLAQVILACGAAQSGANSGPGSDPGYSTACDPETILQRLATLHPGPVLRYALSPGPNGAEILIAHADVVSQHEEVRTVGPSGTGPLWWHDVWTRLHGPCDLTEDVCSQVCPAAIGLPLMAFVSEGKRPQDMADAMLALRKTAMQALEMQRPLVAILPGGAQFTQGPAPDPVQHALWAMLRTVANEYPALHIRAIDPSGQDPCTATEMAQRLKRLFEAAPDDTELVLARDGAKALYVKNGLPARAVKVSASQTPIGMRLAHPLSGRLDDLAWQPFARPTPEAGAVEIEVAATGLNYRDVMWTMGLLPEEALEQGFAGPTLGLECAGRIVRLGAGVSGFSPGDRVLAFGPACFATHLILPQNRVAKLPETLPLTQAAALPVAYFTAHHALVTLGRIKRGETVLIHGGAGGVGLAAIAVAQDAGATVIATAGSPVKQALLRNSGVAHVLSSRSTDFADQVRALTGGAGVDLVLNSLAGQAMEQSLSLLRPFGRFLELGKQDYYANTAIGLRALKDNIAYFGVDVDSVLAARPEAAHDEFVTVMSGLADGRYPPIPYMQFDSDEVTEAFRLMQRSGHIGKIVIRPTAETPTEAMSTRFVPDPDKWHIIAGGLGGLGLETAEWLHHGGARRLALLGRRATPTDEVRIRLERLRASGVDVKVMACDITEEQQVDATLDALRQVAQLGSVYHCAMVLEDRVLAEIDHAMLARILPVKTLGLNNLDQATRRDDLQAFVAFTTLASIIGNHGQAAYVAANSYQDALMAARAAAGLPALALALGAVSDVGHVARQAALGRMLEKMAGNVRFTSTVALRALHDLLSLPNCAPCITITPMKWSSVLGTLRILRTPGHDLLRRLAEAQGETDTTGDLRAGLRIMSFAKAVKRVTVFLKAEISAILRISSDKLSTSRPLSEYGMDSLMGVELTLAAQAALGDDLPVLALNDDLSIERIAEIFVQHIKAGAGQDSPAQNKAQTLLRTLGRQHGFATAEKAAE